MLTPIGATRVSDPEAWERQVRAAMRRARGRTTEAAEALGVSTRTLFRWLAEPPLDDVDKAAPSIHVTAGEPRKRRKRKAA